MTSEYNSTLAIHYFAVQNKTEWKMHDFYRYLDLKEGKVKQLPEWRQRRSGQTVWQVWSWMTCIYSYDVTFDIPWVWLILAARKPTMQLEKGDVTFTFPGMQQRKVKEKETQRITLLCY